MPKRAPKKSKQQPNAENLLLSCMDFRMVEHVVHYMNGLGLKNGFDHVTLAGASLGAARLHNPAWARTFWDHLDFAIGHHKISRVMILDHRHAKDHHILHHRRRLDFRISAVQRFRKQIHGHDRGFGTGLLVDLVDVVVCIRRCLSSCRHKNSVFCFLFP